MNELLNIIEKALHDSSVSLERFRQIATRLLASGVICHGDSSLESSLYNDAKRIESLLDDYFAVIGCKLFHEQDFQYFCLFPPGADVPGIPEDDEEAEASLRDKLNQDEVAAILILRFLYQQILQDGTLTEEAEAQVTLESFNTTMKTRLDRTQPTATKRKEVFRKLRRMKLIRYATDADLDNPDTVFAIRPMITSFVHSEALEQ